MAEKRKLINAITIAWIVNKK